MTVLTSAAPATARPVPWHRTAWVVWRRYRATLLGLVVVLGGLSAYLLVTGHRVRTAYAAVAECQPPADGADCQLRWADFLNTYGNPGFVGAVLLLLPGIIGAFVGAPLIGRELETGVFRYSWTQGIGRMRWAVALIVPAAVGVAAVAGALGLLVRWHDQPLLDSGSRHRLDPSVFPTTGIAVIGWALLAFSGGVLAGILWRRAVPALASCFAVWFGLAYLASTLRLRHPAPLTSTADLRTGDLDLDQWWTKGGVRVGDTEINTKLRALGAEVSDGGIRVHVTPGHVDPLEYLHQHGYTLVHSYQPDSRYWTFAWIESGWLLALSLALLGASFWLLRRLSA